MPRQLVASLTQAFAQDLDIRELLTWAVIVQSPGRGRSTSYRLAEPM